MSMDPGLFVRIGVGKQVIGDPGLADLVVELL